MISGRKILSVITARAGSVSVPGKNFRMINGRPLVQWSILSSIACPLIDLTVISSNCPKVKKAVIALYEEIEYYWKTDIGKLNNFDEFPIGQFEFIQRPDEFATDISKNEEAIIHALDYTRDNFELDADVVLNLQPTSPIRSDGLIQKCLCHFFSDGFDSLFTASKHTPLFFKKIGYEIVADGWDIFNRPMRQGMPESDWKWHDDGNVYITSKDFIMNGRCRLGGKIGMIELTQAQSLQIDTELDFRIAELAMQSFTRT